MKNSLQMGLVELATLILGTFTTYNSAMAVGEAAPKGLGQSETIATAFSQQEVDQSKFIAIAVPLAIGHKLVILEQISATQQCWRETGIHPVKVDPLLLNFDFTGICARSTDSNKYSIHQAGQDLALHYGLRIEKRQGELVLLGSPYQGYEGQAMEIGRTHGIGSELMKISLDPGWRFTKRTFNSKVLNHVYLTQGVEIDGTPNSSSGIRNGLDVAGEVRLNQAQLNINLPAQSSAGDQYVIIKNDGSDPVIGTFAGLPEGASLPQDSRFKITYQGNADSLGSPGNDVVIKYQPTPTPTPTPTLTPIPTLNLPRTPTPNPTPAITLTPNPIPTPTPTTPTLVPTPPQTPTPNPTPAITPKPGVIERILGPVQQILLPLLPFLL